MNWESLIDAESLSQLLPAEYSCYAVPFKQSLVVFLSNLPQRNQAQILAAQISLPSGASLSQRLGRLAHSCPVLQKIGQILARDQRIAFELRNELSRLESMPPTVPWDVIESLLIQELGRLETKSIELLSPAIAEASVAVVIPYKDNSQPNQPEGVFKVLKPGIEERLTVELGILSQVGEYLDNQLSELGIPLLNYQETFEQVRNKLSWELKLDQEQRNLSLAAKFYANQPDIQIPALFMHCTPRITAMERIFGVKITDHQYKSSSERNWIAEVTGRALLARPILCVDDQALFHCDPHAGNVFSTRDGRVAILDWSLAGFLGVSERIALVQVILAAICMRPDKMVNVILGLDLGKQCNITVLRACVERWLRKVRHGKLPGLSWLVGLFDEATQTARLSLSADLLMFRKSLLTLSGVLSEVGAWSFNLDQLLNNEFLRSSLLEWPKRWFSAPDSHLFATRLSNMDILEAVWSSPLIVGRYWHAMWRDLMEPYSVSTVS